MRITGSGDAKAAGVPPQGQESTGPRASCAWALGPGLLRAGISLYSEKIRKYAQFNNEMSHNRKVSYSLLAP